MDKLQIGQPDYITIGQIKKDPDKFVINKEYQRSEAWKPPKRQKLLESIFKNLSIGVLFIVKHKNDRFEILDGQQRIETIKKFLNNGLTTPDNLLGFKDKKYSDLEKDTDSRRLNEFLGFKIWYIPVSGGTEEEVADIFLILQEGQPLNSPEKLNAIQTKMKKFIIEVSKHSTFKTSNMDPWRFSHRHLAAQCVYFYLNSVFDKKEFPNPPRLKDLIDMYKNESISKSLHKNIIGTLDFISQSLQDEIKIIRKKADIIVLFVLAHFVRTHFVSPNEVFRRSVTKFMTEVQNAVIKNGQPQNIYEEYKSLRSAGATKENFKRKFELILQEFEKLEDHVKKDTQRFPTLGQTLRVYYRDDRTCQFCGKRVKFDDISIDHIDPHCTGGPTDIKNLRLVHKGKCHDKLEKQKEIK